MEQTPIGFENEDHGKPFEHATVSSIIETGLLTKPKSRKLFISKKLAFKISPPVRLLKYKSPDTPDRARTISLLFRSEFSPHFQPGGNRTGRSGFPAISFGGLQDLAYLSRSQAVQ